MYKDKLTYKNFNDEEITEILRFDLSELELLDLTKDDPTFSASYMRTLIEQEDAYEMFRFIRKILALSYGELSEDGNVFMKSPELMNKFLHSAAYNALINKIADTQDIQILRNMLMGIFPPKFAEKLVIEETSGDTKVVTAANA